MIRYHTTIQVYQTTIPNPKGWPDGGAPEMVGYIIHLILGLKFEGATFFLDQLLSLRFNVKNLK